MKKICIVLVVAVLLTLSFGQALEASITQEPVHEIHYTYTFPIPSIEPRETTKGIMQQVSIEGLANTQDSDQPSIPVQSVKLLLPPDQTLDTIKVNPSGQHIISKNCNILRGSTLFPVSQGQSLSQLSIGIAPLTIDNPQVIHDRLASVAGIHTFRGYRILILNLYPVQYNADTGDIISFETLELTLTTREASTPGGFRGLNQDKDIVTQMVDNPEMITAYPSILKATGSYEYIIITSEEFKNAQGTNTFQDLIEARINGGLTAGIFTVEEIKANPDYSVNGAWGDNNPSNPFKTDDPIEKPELFDDTPAKIRNFIRYAYSEYGTSYVLLGGDADEIVPKDNIVPLRGLYADEEGLPLEGTLDYEADDIPSDVYYACLDGTFNYDNDNHYGECAEFNDAADIDEADLLAEVWVGRACVDSTEEINNFVMKTLAYEQMEQGEDSYFGEILFVGEYLGFPGVSAYGGNYKDHTEDMVDFPDMYTIHKIYDRDETWDSIFLIEHLSTTPYHLINHDGHGNQYYMLKSGGDNLRYLTNEKPFFIYSHSCLTGSFDNWDCYRGYQTFDCIAEVITCEIPYGAFACILNARYGLGSQDSVESPSGAYDESFYKALFEENIRELGRASHYSKEYYISRIDENGMRWCYYETNLFGDPALQIKDPLVAPEQPAKPAGPLTGKINEEQTYTVSTIDPNGDQVYYFLDWGDGTDSGWMGPYTSGTTSEATHSWTEKGTYQVKVKAKDDAGHESAWSNPLSVYMLKSKSSNYALSLLERFLQLLNNIEDILHEKT
jgi:hypothetical protein